MAGTISLSLSQQFDIYGDPLAGGQLYLMVAGTVSTPQNGYQDLALTVPLPNPITLDAAGRIPQFFLADGYIKIRLQDKHGVVQLASDNILVVGPSSGSGGGGATIDATTVFQTGDMKARYSTGVHPGSSPGWVRANGLTIGSASSSPAATERGNADCQALFTLLWGADVTLAVSGGRGASAAADWGSNKTIATPDYRGYALAALDDMGNTAAGRLTTTYFGTAATVLGAVGGAESQTLDKTQIPAHKHSGTTGDEPTTHNHTIQRPGKTNTQALETPGASAFFWTSVDPVNTVTGNENQFHHHSFTSDDGEGGGLAHRSLGPRKLCTIYLKL